MMGWTFSRQWKTPEDVANELLWYLKNDCETTLVLHELTHEGMWVVARSKCDEEAHMWVHIIQREGSELGYKTVHLCQGPYYYDCSAEFVAAAKTAGVDFAAPDAAAWLARWETAQGAKGAA